MTMACTRCHRKHDHEHCTICGQAFVADTKPDEPPPETCGFVACRARNDWGDDEWEGRARMAWARLAAGRISHRGPIDKEGNRPVEWDTNPLDDLDRQALARFPQGERGAA